METIWTSGEHWRDLTDELADLCEWTAISRSGTARLVRHGQTMRIPLEGGNRIILDGRWNPVSRLTVTPCGIVYDGQLGDWSAGTRLWAVLAGSQPEWNRTTFGRRLLDRVIAREQPDTTVGHPVEPCTGYYCPQRFNAAD